MANSRQSQPFFRTGLLHVPRVDSEAGAAVVQVLRAGMRGVMVQQESYAASDRRWLEDTLIKWCDEEELDLVVTIGGTLPAPGPSGAEVVPEATLAVVERLVPGLAEAMRADVRDEFAGAALFRGVTGIRGRTLVVNLPQGAVAAARFLATIVEDLPLILAHLRGDDGAVTLEEIVGEAEQATDEVWDDAPDDAARAEAGAEDSPKAKGLNAEEFAAFLRRGKRDAE